MSKVWYLAITHEGSEFKAEERLIRSGHDAIALEGRRTICPRKTWPEIRIESFAVYPTYVFVQLDEDNLPNWQIWLGSHRIRQMHTTISLATGNRELTVVGEDVIMQLHNEQASGLHSNWLHKAHEHFKDKIGTTIKLPASHHSWPGVEVQIIEIKGDCIRWRFEIFNHVTTGTVKMGKVWDLPDVDGQHALEIKLSETHKLYGVKADIEPQADLVLPAPPLARAC